MRYILLLVGAMLIASCSSSHPVEKPTISLSKASKVEVIYFHNNRRCATCEAVEEVTRNTLTTSYAGKVAFSTVNTEDKTSASKVKEFQVTGQTLLVIGGEKPINITNEAFLYAKSQPDKLKALIESIIIM